jgi:mRNA interferase YafQ
MKTLRVTTQYKKDLKLAQKRGRKINKLVAIVDKLRDDEPLSPIDDDHPLKGPWDGYRGCHVQGDWCLIYQDNGDELVLVRTGTHSDLFKR